jgi:hypothetical protein
MTADMDLPYRIRIGSIEPNTLNDDVLRIWSECSNIVPHLHMPLQSGCDTILRSMKRRYNTSMYRERVQTFAELFPDAGIGIDVIAGYPGETQSHFDETVQFLHSIPWTYLHVFTYSERELTPAANYSGAVPMNERRERTRIRRAQSPTRTSEFHQPQMFGESMMVSCTVTAFGKPVTMHLPVMDHRNKAIPNPNAFDVNKNMMRCLVKAIACHGLGLYIYAGEDLPEQSLDEKLAAANTVADLTKIWKSLSQQEQTDNQDRFTQKRIELTPKEAA